jgi:type II secretory pathway pseudopilin PulG
VEATIVLAIVSILTALLGPAVVGYIDQARQARAREDTKVIGDALSEFIEDNAEHMFLQNGSDGSGDTVPPTRADANRVNLLVSDGDIPALATAVSTETFWTTAINGTTVDTLENHLVENVRNSTEPKDTAKRYRNPTDVAITTPGGSPGNIDFSRAESSNSNAPYAWRGAYLRSALDSDPWGSRYAVNVAFLDPRLDATPTTISGITAGFTTAAYLRLDVFVLSAGPDEEIDTQSAQDGAVPGDDDFIYLVSSHAK